MRTIAKMLAVAGVLALAVHPAWAQEKTRAEMMKETLKGGSGGVKTRGFVTRGLSTPAPAAPAKSRTLYVSRGIRGAEPMKAFFGDPKTTVTEVKAPGHNPNAGSQGDLGVHAGEDAYKVEYKVDPASQLKGEIFFHKGRSDIRTGTGSLAFLNDLATALKDPEMRHLKFVIEGHASAEGNAVRNKILSQARANRIYEMLVDFGVHPHQIFPAGFGEDEARFPDHAPEHSLAQDRRVLIYKLED